MIEKRDLYDRTLYEEVAAEGFISLIRGIYFSVKFVLNFPFFIFGAILWIIDAKRQGRPWSWNFE